MKISVRQMARLEIGTAIAAALADEWGACRDIVPLGQVKSRFNYNVDLKRVLNFENVVDETDNIKQDMSIDVYGRKDKEEKPKEKAAAPAAKVSSCLLFYRCAAFKTVRPHLQECTSQSLGVWSVFFLGQHMKNVMVIDVP